MDIFGGIRRWAGQALGFDLNKAQDLQASPPITPIPQGPGGMADGSGLGQAQQVLRDINPGVRATLDTISKAEGTWSDSAQAPDYTMRFADSPGEGSLDVSAPHPLDVRGSRYGSGYRSNASGAYQFMGGGNAPTWQEMNDGTNAVMSPSNQDAAAERLIRERTDYDFDKPFPDQAYKLSSQWASIGDESGRSAYGQPTKDADMLNDFYNDRYAALEEQRRQDIYQKLYN